MTIANRTRILTKHLKALLDRLEPRCTPNEKSLNANAKRQAGKQVREEPAVIDDFRDGVHFHYEYYASDKAPLSLTLWYPDAGDCHHGPDDPLIIKWPNWR